MSAISDKLILETPDPVVDTEFRFAKIRAAESIIKTRGGYMHAPGGECYYAAIWANDQAEYVNPFSQCSDTTSGIDRHSTHSATSPVS